MEYLLEAVNKYSIDKSNIYRIKQVEVSDTIKQEPVKGLEYTEIDVTNFLSSFLSSPTAKREWVKVEEGEQVTSDESNQGKAGQGVKGREAQ